MRIDMNGNNWVRALRETDIKEDQLITAFPKGVGVLISRISGRIYAVLNRCPHMACPLSAGSIKNGVVTCACHEWRFDLRDGFFLDAPEIKVPVFDTRIENGEVFINLEGVI